MISSSIEHTALGGHSLHDEMGQYVPEASCWIYKGPGRSLGLSLGSRPSTSQQSPTDCMTEDSGEARRGDYLKDTGHQPQDLAV